VARKSGPASSKNFLLVPFAEILSEDVLILGLEFELRHSTVLFEHFLDEHSGSYSHDDPYKSKSDQKIQKEFRRGH